MQTALRTSRTILRNAGRPAPGLTTRQRETRERVLTYAQTLMAAVGTRTLKFSTLAAAVYVAPSTLRRHFADLDTLLATQSEIPTTDPDCDAKRRAAYLAATRTPTGALTEAHRLLVRHFLPQDELTHIEAYRHHIGTLLAGDRAQLIFPILDNPCATAEDFEALLYNRRAAAPPPVPCPATVTKSRGKRAAPPGPPGLNYRNSYHL